MTERAQTNTERARERRAIRDASGEVYVDGSIYEGMAASLQRSGRTIAHVIEYADAVEIAAAMSTPRPTQTGGSGGEVERYKHAKRGTVYAVVGTASLQIATGDLVDGSDLIVYCGEDGRLWAREEGEFHDGRFERLSAATPNLIEPHVADPSRPITMQDVRLFAGESKLTAADVLAGCSAELARRARVEASWAGVRRERIFATIRAWTNADEAQAGRATAAILALFAEAGE